MALNNGYALAGAVLGTATVFCSYKIFDSLTKFDTSEELGKNNIAAGLVAAAAMLGAAYVAGSVISSALN